MRICTGEDVNINIDIPKNYPKGPLGKVGVNTLVAGADGWSIDDI